MISLPTSPPPGAVVRNQHVSALPGLSRSCSSCLTAVHWSNAAAYALGERESYIHWLGLSGRHVEKTAPDTLDLFPSCVREPKIDCLDLYTYVYTYVHLCPVRAEIFNRIGRPQTGQSSSKPDTWPPYQWLHDRPQLTMSGEAIPSAVKDRKSVV